MRAEHHKRRLPPHRTQTHILENLMKFSSSVTRWFALACFGVGLGFAQPALAEYPERPVRVIVPFGAGGSTDVVARTVATRLTAAYGKAVIVENIGGGNGIVGSSTAAKAPADGYTIMMGVFAHALMPSLYKNLPFSLEKDFTPVIQIGKSTQLLIVNNSLPVKTVPEFITYLKANPGKLNFGAGGAGTASHVTAEMFLSMSQTKAQHVQYRSGGMALNDLVGGQVQFMFDSVLTSQPLVEGGKVRALAVTSATRSPIVGTLPTIAESGVRGFESSIWFGFFVPAGTPRDIVGKLNADIAKVLKDPAVTKTMAAQGLEVVAQSPEAFASVIKSEVAKWKTVVEQSNIKVE